MTLTEITTLNYYATVRRGLVTDSTTKMDFVKKLREEVTEFSRSGNFAEMNMELADIALVCFAIAHHYEIDLVGEMERKMRFNQGRAGK